MNIVQILASMKEATLQNKDLTDVFGDKIKSIPDLFRGDSIDRTRFPLEDWRNKGDTFANLIVSDGIISKFHDGHSSLDILTKATEFLVSCHVGYKTPNKEEQSGVAVPEEVRISKFSPFISFTQTLKHSAKFQNRDKKIDLENCPYEDATHFIFKLEGLKGYEYKQGMYKPSSKNGLKLNQQRIVRAKEDFLNSKNIGSIIKSIAESAALNNVDSMTPVLVLTAIHVETYINNINTTNIDNNLVKSCIDRAKKWDEWLVYPGLPGTTDGHYQRIPPCNELTLEHYGKKLTKLET